MNRLLERKPYFELIEGKAIGRNFSIRWQNFGNGVVIPSKLLNCKNWRETANGMCEACEKTIYQYKECKPNVNELKSNPPEERCHRLPFSFK